MSENKPEVNLGKAALFLAVIAACGIAASTMGLPLYGFIGALAAIAAIGLGGIWLVTRRAVNKATARN